MISFLHIKNMIPQRAQPHSTIFFFFFYQLSFSISFQTLVIVVELIVPKLWALALIINDINEYMAQDKGVKCPCTVLQWFCYKIISTHETNNSSISRGLYILEGTADMWLGHALSQRNSTSCRSKTDSTQETSTFMWTWCGVHQSEPDSLQRWHLLLKP